MSALEVESVLQKMAAMREEAGHWALGAGFEFQELYAVLEKVHAKVVHAEPLVDSRSSAAYSLFISDLRRVVLRVDDALDKFSSSTTFSSRARRKLLGLVRIGGSALAPQYFRQMRPQPSRDQVTMLVLRPKIANQFEEAHRDLQMLLRLFSTYVSDLLPKYLQPQEIYSNIPSDGTIHVSQEPGLIGREQDKDHVLRIINESDTRVVAIVGMAGVGKTSLTKYVHGVAKDAGFDYHMWVDVNQDFSPERIFRSVMTSFSEKLQLDEDPESSWWSMKQGLVDKKYLLVLDNVWNEDPHKWNQLLHLLFTTKVHVSVPHEKRKLHGSKVIVTTRIPAAAAAIPSAKTYNLQPLPVEDSLKLLTVGNASAVERKVVERCSGLPKLVGFLKPALKGICQGGGEHAVQEFDLRCMDDPGLLHVAKASYNHLPPHLQRCFLYYSLFPLGHIFDAEEMINLCVAEGLSHVSMREAQVDDNFSKLLDECFDDLDKSGFRGKMRYKMQYILHNFARNEGKDLYKAFKIEDCSSLSEHSIRYMSLMVDHTTEELPVSLNEQKDLRTLILLRNQEMILSCQKSKIRELPSEYCRYLTALRVLDLHATRIEKLPETFDMLSNLRYLNLSQTDIAKLPESFDKLQYLIYLNIAQTCIAAIPRSIDRIKSLRYLNLSQTGVRELPESIGNLPLLQTLQLSHCEKLVKLPHSIASLTGLQKLDLEGCHYLAEMPQDISNMKNLKELNVLECPSLDQMPVGLSALTKIEVLPRYIVMEGNEGTIMELQGLTSMKRLGLENLERVSLTDAKEIRLKEKSKLENLTLRWNINANIGNSEAERQHNNAQLNEGNSSSDMEQQRDGQPIIDSLQPNKELKTLEIISYGGRTFPVWLNKDLLNLVQIRLVNLKCTKLPPLGELPCLATVEISGMDAIMHVGDELHDTNGTFCSLKKLTFSQMLNLKSCPAINGDTCPKLAELSIIQCPNLQTLSKNLPIEKLTLWMSPHELLCNGLIGVGSSLKSMSISLCEELSSSDFEGLTMLSRLEELEISCCDGLGSLPLGMQNLPKLRRLSIIGCPRFHSLTDLSQCTTLKSLHISGCLMPSQRFEREHNL